MIGREHSTPGAQMASNKLPPMIRAIELATFALSGCATQYAPPAGAPSKRALALALLVTFGSAIAADASALTPDNCAVLYENEESLANAIRTDVSNSRPATLPKGHVAKAMSPEGTGALSTYGFDSAKEGNGKVVVAAKARGSKPTFISFEPARSVDAKWLNERLIYVQVWWGRIVASEIVFDVVDGQSLYKKTANYGRLISSECADVQPETSP